MGFTLKKVVSAFLMPLSIGLLIFAIGLWFLYTNSYKKAKIYLTVGFLWIFIISYSPFSNFFVSTIESKYPLIQSNVQAKYILLLGGDYEGRAYEAIRLYHHIPNSKIITSGYAGRSKVLPEAIENANRLIALGIPKKDILIQSEPKDTLEEAMYVKKIVKNEPFILVTSAYHMPRAMQLFQKVGLNPISAPTNFLVKKSLYASSPKSSELQKTEVTLHEYTGMLWNKIKELL